MRFLYQLYNLENNFSYSIYGKMSGIVEEIKSHKLSEVIGRFVHLKNEGAGRKKGCCPFHNEKTPSFFIDDRNGLYHCFGCNAGGDVFTFIQNLKQLDFPQAVEHLCDILNIDKSKYSTQEIIQKEQEHKTFYQAMEIVAKYYQECLHDNQEAYNYVKTIREINDETENEFMFGLAENDVDKIISYCKIRDINEELLKKCGIIRDGKNTDNEAYKYLFFRDRIMIPIHNSQGKIVAFGGRIYKSNDNNAKYLNSSDNEYFKKGNILFNFHRAKKNIGKDKNGIEQPLIIVEGYMDSITLWQNGFKTAIAPLGTSITTNHLRTIFSYCQTPIFVFDSDDAGKRATIRACEMMFSLLKTGLIPKICTLQGAKDVDEFLKKYTRDDLQNQFDNAKDINQFVIEAKQQNFDLTNPNELSLLQKEIYALTNVIPDDILKQNYKDFFQNEFNKISAKNKPNLNKNYSNSTKFLAKKSNPKYQNNYAKPTINDVGMDFIEKRIIALLLQNKDLQDDIDIDENIVAKLSQKNQKLLAELNGKSEEQQQTFSKKYIDDAIIFQDNVKNILNNLTIQWELKKIEISDLPIDIKSEERKKILEKKKRLLHQDF